METQITPEPFSRRRAIVVALATASAIFVVTLLLQIQSGAYHSEFGAHADEPAHVVTGMMVRDYLAGGLLEGVSPMSFARDYYERYPKVALGHYPPVFYLIEGVWLIPVRSPTAVLVFMAILGTAAAWMTWKTARSHGLPPAAAWVPAALFIACPLVRTYTAIVMSDLLLVIFCLLAVDAWRRFLGSASRRDAIAFGLWAAIAILTKGSALFLALIPPLSIALSGRWSLVKTRALWLAPIPVVLFAMPWMIATRKITAEGMSNTPLLEYIAEAAPFFAKNLISEFGWLACLLLLAVCVRTILRAVRRRLVDDSTACQVAVVVGLIGFYIAIPSGLDARYFLPLVPALFLLVADLARSSAAHLAKSYAPELSKGKMEIAVTAIACLIPLGIVVETQRPVEKQFEGYAQVIDAIAAETQTLPEGEFIDVLVASGPHGEGSVTTAAVFRRDLPFRIHRSTKALIQTDWVGREPKPIAAAGADTWQLVKDLGIDWILLEEMSGQPQVDLLEQSIPVETAASAHTLHFKGDVSHQLNRIQVNPSPDRSGLIPR